MISTLPMRAATWMGLRRRWVWLTSAPTSTRVSRMRSVKHSCQMLSQSSTEGLSTCRRKRLFSVMMCRSPHARYSCDSSSAVRCSQSCSTSCSGSSPRGNLSTNAVRVAAGRVQRTNVRERSLGQMEWALRSRAASTPMRRARHSVGQSSPQPEMTRLRRPYTCGTTPSTSSAAWLCRPPKSIDPMKSSASAAREEVLFQLTSASLAASAVPRKLPMQVEWRTMTLRMQRSSKRRSMHSTSVSSPSLHARCMAA
mmetsp:Transcript_10290/g.41875  ORF Transcript_10290/g.41875 Transcript_10290/m.41875 type:complete len:254 (-) Transcript_10290:2090-2851(-)